MKRLHLILLLTLLLTTACTQNHGYIGRLFGSWYLYEMTENGESVDITVYGDTFWSFQSKMIMISVVDAYMGTVKHYGTFEESDNEIILNFNHVHDGIQPGTGGYGPPTWMGLPGSDNVALTYVIKENTRMALRYTDAEGTVYEYYLRKTY